MTIKRAKPKAKPTKRAPKGLAPKTSESNPAQMSHIVILPMRQSGVVVNEDTALTLGAVWACVRVISESLAGLPWNPYRVRPNGGQDKLLAHPTNWLLDVQPNDETAAFQWRETLVAHALVWGNGYAEIERDAIGRPVGLWQITPDRVEVMRLDGRIVYEVSNHDGPPTHLQANDMFHLRGLGFDGLVGYPVVRMAARAIGGGLATEKASTSLFENDSTPGGLLMTDKTMKAEEITAAREAWQAMHGGPNNRRRVAILQGGLKWEQTGLPPEDAQLLEQRQFTPTEIARWFRVPPHKIADLTRSTNNNIEHQSIEFVNDTLRPWAERLESEADIKLYGRNNQGTIRTIIDMNELLRGDMASQTQFLKETFDRGMLSVDEGRLWLNMNPIGTAAGGAKRFVMANMQVLDKAGEEPPPMQKPEPQVSDEPQIDDTEIDEETDDELRARLSRDCQPIIEDACRRIVNRERDARKMSGDALGEWLAKHRDYCREVLSPGVRLLASILTDDADAVTAVALASFVDTYLLGPGDEHYQAHAARIRSLVVAACGAVKQ